MTSALNDKCNLSCEIVPGVDLPIIQSVNQPMDPYLNFYPNLSLNTPLTSDWLTKKGGKYFIFAFVFQKG